MGVIIYDFESTYDQNYSLSKLTLEEYLRDPRFEVIGVAVKVNNNKTQWFSGTKQETKRWLKQFDWENNLAVAHNAAFDAAILSWHFDIHPRRLGCTLSMARAIVGSTCSVSLGALAEHFQIGVKGNEVIAAKGLRRADFLPEHLGLYGAYCINDVELTAKLFNILGENFPLDEFKLIDLTLKMFTEPVLELDQEVLHAHLFKVREKKHAALALVGEHLKDIMSNNKFAELLRERGIEPPLKISPTTGKETYAFAKTDEAFIELLDHPNPHVSALVTARAGLKSTLEETRTQRFIEIAARGDNFPIPLRYYAAHTGRAGGDGKINLQNLPHNSPLKDAICAPDGYYIVNTDSAAIEARVLAWLAEQDDLVDAFERGEDVYVQMASAIYGEAEDKIDRIMRHIGKVTILSCGFGVGWSKFQATCKAQGVFLSDDEAKRIINTYRQTYPKIPELWTQCGSALAAMLGNRSVPVGRAGVLSVEGVAGIKSPGGLRLKYPNLRWVELEPGGKPQFVYDNRMGKVTGWKKTWPGSLCENVVQHLARNVVFGQMLKISKRYRVAFMVHDSVVCVVPKDQIDTAVEYINLCMKLRPSWAMDLPLNCETTYGATYGAC